MQRIKHSRKIKQTNTKISHSHKTHEKSNDKPKVSFVLKHVLVNQIRAF